jgi:hypothetical protein
MLQHVRKRLQWRPSGKGGRFIAFMQRTLQERQQRSGGSSIIVLPKIWRSPSLVMKNQSSLNHQITCSNAICIEAEPNLGGSMLKNRRNFFLDEDQYTRLVKKKFLHVQERGTGPRTAPFNPM